MIVKVNNPKEKKKFEPIELTVTIETEAELMSLWVRLSTLAEEAFESLVSGGHTIHPETSRIMSDEAGTELCEFHELVEEIADEHFKD